MNRASAEYEAADVAGDSVGGEMNEELRKAIRALSEAAFQTGRWRLSPIAPTDADINAAEAAVVAIFEAREANRKQLAEAARALAWDVASYLPKNSRLREKFTAVEVALTAYNKKEAVE
jgi:hypothetical protein